MKQPCKGSIARVADVLFTSATLLLPALLIFQCADIYRTGLSPENQTATGVLLRDMYSREIVAERFSRISWAFALWLALLLFVLILRAVSRDERREKPVMSPESRLELLRTRVTATPAMLAEKQARAKAARLCAAVCALCAVCACVWGLNPARFSSRDLESVMGAMLWRVTPWVLAAFAAMLLLARKQEQSVAREIEAARSAPACALQPRQAKRHTLRTVARASLFAASAALIVAGILNGGMYDVLVKAVNICTECIGLG